MSRLERWLQSEKISGMESFLNTEPEPDADIIATKKGEAAWREALFERESTEAFVRERRKRYQTFYRIVASAGGVLFILVLLYVVSRLPAFGEDYPPADVVAQRYIEAGLEETGATNVVAGMILDYRAFDTLGESFVLFTALLCATMLLRIDRRNMRDTYEDYHTVRQASFFDTSQDAILRQVGLYLVPFILLFGIYILLNGHLSPGGGFSGGAILGAALILLSASLGFDAADRLLTYKRLNLLSFAALGFYSLSKCYVFFTGANGIHNGIPKGTPGMIFSAGLILPLNIAVGLVVACTMYGFYSLFRRGKIGNA